MATNLTGRFVLDRDRSESLYKHMRAMGCEEIAALASEKLNVTLDVVHNQNSLTLWQSSQLGETKRALNLEGTTTESGVQTGARTAKTYTQDRFVVIETTFARGRIVDRRTMQDDVMVQMLELQVKGSEQVIRTQRFFKRVGPPDPAVILT